MLYDVVGCMLTSSDVKACVAARCDATCCGHLSLWSIPGFEPVRSCEHVGTLQPPVPNLANWDCRKYVKTRFSSIERTLKQLVLYNSLVPCENIEIGFPNWFLYAKKLRNH